jgi:hypothetical protein
MSLLFVFFFRQINGFVSLPLFCGIGWLVEVIGFVVSRMLLLC